MFGLVIPDKTANITCTSENLKPAKQAKQFSVFDILRVNYQNYFLGLGVILMIQNKLF